MHLKCIGLCFYHRLFFITRIPLSNIPKASTFCMRRTAQSLLDSLQVFICSYSWSPDLCELTFFTRQVAVTCEGAFASLYFLTPFSGFLNTALRSVCDFSNAAFPFAHHGPVAIKHLQYHYILC